MNTSQPSRSANQDSSRIAAFDLLRMLAIACIALRHLMSISGYEVLPLPRFLGLGVITTLSGYLALCSADPSWSSWWRRRLIRLYVPYWQVLAILLTANFLTHYKPITWELFFSQILGTAYFTHPGQQIGVHTWFVSLMLMTSLFTVLIRWHLFFLPIILALVCSTYQLQSVFGACTLAFVTGAMLRSFGGGWSVTSVLAALFLFLGSYVNYGFYYPGAGCIGLLLANALPRFHSPLITTMGNSTYEFFLLHGPVYLACYSVLGWSFEEILVFGTLIACLSTWLLRQTTSLLLRTIHSVRRQGVDLEPGNIVVHLEKPIDSLAIHRTMDDPSILFPVQAPTPTLVIKKRPPSRTGLTHTN